VLPIVRRADASDLALLPEIDQRAESLFHVAGMQLPEIPFPVDALHESKAVFVAGRPPVGFVQVDEVDGIAHVQELAVIPSHMRQGIGSALLDRACEWARSSGYPAITLTTYAEVAWNAPFYASRGFVELDSLTPELAELRDWERDVGLDEVGRRVAMRRELRSRPVRRRTSSVTAAAAVIPTRLIPSCAKDSQVSCQCPSTPATAALPAAGMVVTEMNTPTKAADLVDDSDSIPAVPATKAVMSENQPG
jgi:GNAT superfamily N-acetyltransferase